MICPKCRCRWKSSNLATVSTISSLIRRDVCMFRNFATSSEMLCGISNTKPCCQNLALEIDKISKKKIPSMRMRLRNVLLRSIHIYQMALNFSSWIPYPRHLFQKIERDNHQTKKSPKRFPKLRRKKFPKKKWDPKKYIYIYKSNAKMNIPGSCECRLYF